MLPVGGGTCGIAAAKNYQIRIHLSLRTWSIKIYNTLSSDQLFPN